MVATTSDSHRAPDERTWVDSSNGGQLEHEVGDHRADAAADDLGDDVERRCRGC